MMRHIDIVIPVESLLNYPLFFLLSMSVTGVRNYLHTSLDNFIAILNLENTREVALAASRMTHFVFESKDKESLFIAEIVESILFQWRFDFDKLDMSEDEKRHEIEELIAYLEKLKDIVMKSDRIQLFDCLIDFRFFVTEFQLTSPAKYKSREEK